MEQSRVRHPIAIQFRIKGTLKKAENLRGGQKQKNLRQRPDGRWVWHWDPQFMTQGERHNEFDDIDRLAAAARAITVPTLLVRGGISDVVSVDGAQELKALIPHAHLVDVAGAGHMVAGDRNDRFSDAVLVFLDSLRRT